ncbi:MAG: thiamine pyrophosphate-binding protein [Boseongicola sp.]|nr:thiamine pyrophosphate-binding protein [Boseongicola sp.]
MTDQQSSANLRHGGTVLVEALVEQGVERIFCVPGESFLAALDGLYDSNIDVIVNRQEGGSAMMAEADGKLTGRPGVAFVTRGPGATNAAAGVHIAFQDSTPMVLFVGQVASDQRDREAFQEVDYRAMFEPLAKWVAEIDRTDRIPEYISRAFHTAMSGRPGPVVLALPEDVLSAPCDATALPPATPAGQGASTEDIQRIISDLRTASKPFLMIGGGGWDAEAREALGTFAEAIQVPVGTSFRCQDYMDNRHPNYAGDVGIGINPALAQRIREADHLFVLGPRLGEMTTGGYALIDAPNPSQKLTHVHSDPEELGRVYWPSHAIAAQPARIIRQLAGEVKATSDQGRKTAVKAARNAFLDWKQPVATPGSVQMERIVRSLNETLDERAIITNGAGNYAGWVHRYYMFRGWRTQLAPTSGSMGYGLPAAVAAKLRHPDRDVICFAGDGCFQMISQEFGTACQYGANVIILIHNNGIYGTIRMHQEKNYPGRVSGTTMVNPDFAALARCYGAFGATVERTADFEAAFAAARASGTPAILDLRVSSEALTTTARLSS